MAVVRATQFRAIRAANVEVLHLYWSIGRDILGRQKRDGWGAKVVERLAADLKREFPEQRGWTRSNLLYMRKFAEAWSDEPGIVPTPLGQLSWSHIRVLIDKLDVREERDWYALTASQNGWSSRTLTAQIALDYRSRLGAAPSNFESVLSHTESELAQQLVKDPYIFEHLGLVDRTRERAIETALMSRIQDTLLEFGRGMTLVGRQYRLPLSDGTEYVLDLLLFHVEQLRYIVIELKVTDFSPEHLGQLGAYVAAVDGELRNPELHAPTIGILLCTGRSGASVNYSLNATAVPVAVADYRHSHARAALPDPAELQAILTNELGK
ncbi:MAG: PDDEXK nuclease domain-containing protein [Promicromonosporaceae bacterium]|nr:PDDEXK nuclease domain-containing protein [Promicromonosporaceae bacterium]